MKNVARNLNFALLCGVVAFGLNGLRKFIDGVASRKSDIEYVILPSGFLQVDGILSRLASEQARTFVTDNTRP